MENMQELNSLEKIEISEGSFCPSKVRFNGLEFFVGQGLVSNGSHHALPEGQKVKIKLFDPGTDALFNSQSLWMSVTTEEGFTVQGDPFNFKGFEKTKRDNSSIFDSGYEELSCEQKRFLDSARKFDQAHKISS